MFILSILTYTNIDSDGYNIDFLSYFHEKGIVDYYIENIRYLSHNDVSKDFLELVNNNFHPILKQKFDENIQVMIITDDDSKELYRRLIHFGTGFIAINKNSDPISMLLIENEISKRILSNKKHIEYTILHELGHLKVPDDLNYDKILPIIKSRINNDEKIPSVDLICCLKNIIEDIWVNKKIATEKKVNLEEYFATNSKDVFISKINNTNDFIRILNYLALCVLSDRLSLNLISLFHPKREIKENQQLLLQIYNLFSKLFDTEPNKDKLINAIIEIYTHISKFRFKETRINI